MLLLFARVGDCSIAIDAAQVVAVVDLAAVVPAPRAERSVLGIAPLRSRVVTVLDTHALLGIEGGARRRLRAIVAQVEGHEYAFPVDAVEDVSDAAVAPLAPGMSPGGAWTRAAGGLIEHEGELVVLVDLAALVPGLALTA